jgi:hypothetical protein
MKKSSLSLLAYLMLFSVNVFGNTYQGKFSQSVLTTLQKFKGKMYGSECRHHLTKNKQKHNIWNRCILAWADDHPEVLDEESNIDGLLTKKLSDKKQHDYYVRDLDALEEFGNQGLV